MRQIDCGAYLCLASLSLMARYTNIIKDPVQLVDDVVDLGGQITRVDRHGEYEYMPRNPKASNRKRKANCVEIWLQLQRGVW